MYVSDLNALFKLEYLRLSNNLDAGATKDVSSKVARKGFIIRSVGQYQVASDDNAA